MTKSLFGDVEDYRIFKVWGRLIFLSSIATACVYTLFGLFAFRRLIREDFRWTFVLIAYFVVGMLHAFLSLAILCLACACVFYTFEQPMKNEEMVTYSGILVVVVIYFASARKSMLHSF